MQDGLIICVIHLMMIALCSGLGIFDYPYLYTAVINGSFVRGQKNITVCAVIELVEDQYYLLPRVCFDRPRSNQKIKVALQQELRLNFTNLVYKPFILRWESPYDYVILEKCNKYNFKVFTMPETDHSTKKYMKTTPTKGGFARSTPGYNLSIITASEKSEITDAYTFETVVEKRKRYHFSDELLGRPRRNGTKDPMFHVLPWLKDEKNLPPRILITVPGSAYFEGCFILGWGTFFSKNKCLKQLEGLELKRSTVYAINPEVLEGKSSSNLSEIWYKREEGQACVEDLGSPMVCKTRGRAGAEAVVGLFMGGRNCTPDHEFDSFKSFEGSFQYITYWAIGTNVSVTGDPRRWTMWPLEWDDTPKSRGIELQFRINIFEFNVFILLLLML